MNRVPTNRTRLLATLDTTRREFNHLAYSWRQLFVDRNVDVKWVSALDDHPDEAVVLEAFVSRFARLQDTLAARAIPLWLEALAESTSSQIENLSRAERLGVIASTEDWLARRQIRNQLVHEYMECADDLVAALAIAKQVSKQFADTQNAIVNYLLSAFPSIRNDLAPLRVEFQDYDLNKPTG